MGQEDLQLLIKGIVFSLRQRKLLTKEIVKVHGGAVKAYNDNGAVFEILLPETKTNK